MGKIFKISNNPVSTIMNCFDETVVLREPVHDLKKTRLHPVDTFVSRENSSVKSNPFIKMRNGVGKLMSHFQRPEKNKI